MTQYKVSTRPLWCGVPFIEWIHCHLQSNKNVSPFFLGGVNYMCGYGSPGGGRHSPLCRSSSSVPDNGPQLTSFGRGSSTRQTRRNCSSRQQTQCSGRCKIEKKKLKIFGFCLCLFTMMFCTKEGNTVSVRIQVMARLNHHAFFQTEEHESEETTSQEVFKS